MSEREHHCHLYVIRAAEADVAVVFRRGPTAWWHILKWDLRTLQLEGGAWLRGRLYPRQCALSPDGQLLCHFAYKREWQAYFAVSKLPWLTALAAWRSYETSPAACRFGPGDELTLSGPIKGEGPFHGSYPGTVNLTGQPWNPTQRFDYYFSPFWNELSAGWHMTGALDAAMSVLRYRPFYSTAGARFFWAAQVLKKLRDLQERDSWLLTLVHGPGRSERFRRHWVGNVPVDFFLHDPAGEIEHLDVAWADWDRQGRLLQATFDGTLEVRVVGEGGLQTVWSADLNDLQPDPQPSPDWACKW